MIEFFLLGAGAALGGGSLIAGRIRFETRLNFVKDSFEHCFLDVAKHFTRGDALSSCDERKRGNEGERTESFQDQKAKKVKKKRIFFPRFFPLCLFAGVIPTTSMLHNRPVKDLSSIMLQNCSEHSNSRISSIICLKSSLNEIHFSSQLPLLQPLCKLPMGTPHQSQPPPHPKNLH
jgi:hypothetical protein